MWKSFENVGWQTSEKVSWEKSTEASKLFTKMGTWGGKGSLKVVGNVTIIRPHMISSSHSQQ